MTVQELITELEKIEDKAMIVGRYYELNPWTVNFYPVRKPVIESDNKRVVLS